MDEPLCTFLSWDSNFFGRRIGRVNRPKLSPTDYADVDAWCADNDIDCVYLLTGADDFEMGRLAQAARFDFVDIRLTFERKLATDFVAPVANLVRPAISADLPMLKTIARKSYAQTRFCFDPRFTQPACEALYVEWIERSCDGYADRVFVAADGADAPLGYITCDLKADGRGQIGLIGVAAEARGRGVGRDLVNAALNWCVAQSAEQCIVVTQGRNINAQRLYQRSGFVTQNVQLWHHKWFSS